MPYFDQDGITMHHGDCREILPTLPECSVNTCVTSPPYWGLRDYGHADQLGLEPTPEQYVANMVAVFREVRRVLREDGTLWLNIGDTYAGYHGNKNAAYDAAPSNKGGYFENQRQTLVNHNGIKNKDLVGIPWRVAFALQADGWWLRQDIIWHKPNPMPESVTDRCTKAHEYIFLLAKKPKYYFDSSAMQEDGVTPAGTKGAKGSAERASTPGVNSRPPEYKIYDGKRNKRSVWSVTTKPYKGAHFATYPQELIEPCIRAGCPEGGLVLDPFIGSGTTAAVAQKCGCKFVGCELNATYLDLAAKRFRQRGLPFDVA